MLFSVSAALPRRAAHTGTGDEYLPLTSICDLSDANRSTKFCALITLNVLWPASRLQSNAAQEGMNTSLTAQTQGVIEGSVEKQDLYKHTNQLGKTVLYRNRISS